MVYNHTEIPTGTTVLCDITQVTVNQIVLKVCPKENVMVYKFLAPKYIYM